MLPDVNLFIPTSNTVLHDEYFSQLVTVWQCYWMGICHWNGETRGLIIPTTWVFKRVIVTRVLCLVDFQPNNHCQIWACHWSKKILEKTNKRDWAYFTDSVDTEWVGAKRAERRVRSGSVYTIVLLFSQKKKNNSLRGQLIFFLHLSVCLEFWCMKKKLKNKICPRKPISKKHSRKNVIALWNISFQKNGMFTD